MSTIGLIGRTPAACSRDAIQAGDGRGGDVGDRRGIARAELGILDR